MSLFKFSNEKRPRIIVSWFKSAFRFAFRWLFRVSSSTERAVTHCITLQHTAPHGTILQWDLRFEGTCTSHRRRTHYNSPTHCDTLQRNHSTLRRTAMHCNTLQHTLQNIQQHLSVQLLPQFVCVAVCCSVLQCVAVCCSVLQCVTVCCSVLQYVAVCCSVLQCAVGWQCAAVLCNVLQCIPVCCITCTSTRTQVPYTHIHTHTHTYTHIHTHVNKLLSHT